MDSIIALRKCVINLTLHVHVFFLGAIYNFNLFEIMTTLTFAMYDRSDPSGFIHFCLLFALCLVVIGPSLALMAAG